MKGSLNRLAAVTAIVAGIVIAITPFAFSLVGNANGGERITDRFRFTLSDEGLVQLQSGFKTTVGMGNQFFGQTLPDVRRELHQSPAVFRADLRRNYPAIVTAQAQVPPVVALVTPKLPGLVALHSDFQKVDSLPFLGLPISSIPWLLIGIGIVVGGLGLIVLARPSRAGAALVAAAGLALIAVPLVVSAFDKTDAAVNLDKAGSFVFAPQITAAALATTQRIDNLVKEVEAKFIPRTAAQLHESPARLKAQIAARYPAVGRGLAAWPSIGPRALKQSHDQVASVKDYADLHGIHFRALPWTVIGPGIAMLLAGLVAVALPGVQPRVRARA
jgi:hypothetical protein